MHASAGVLYSFQNSPADGQDPEASLLGGEKHYYGTTVTGGASDSGTIYSYNSKTGAESILYSFQNNGADGNKPISGLIDVDGTLYGTTSAGGTGNCQSVCGTVFSFDPATRSEHVVYSFCSQQNCADGADPGPYLIDVNGLLFGTTAAGGGGYQNCESTGCGTVFSVDPATGAETVLHAFCPKQGCADGSNPQSGLVQAKNLLYGATVSGGANGDGTLFSINPVKGTEKVVYSFQGGKNDGAIPNGNLTYFKGLIFGTTTSGGKHDGGTVYSFDPKTGTETLLYSFCAKRDCRDGWLPLSGVIAVSDKLYGTTLWGGNAGCSSGCGVIFSVNRKTGAEKVLYSFCSQISCTDGALPLGGLFYQDKFLYGTTEQGGSGSCSQFLSGCGTIFKIKK